MYVDFTCPECGNKLRAKQEFSGKKGKCPKCSKMINIPKPAAKADTNNQD
jgi:predicted RNA-binding Zn-ribbon protein involved in translation (DUF1610 family)